MKNFGSNPATSMHRRMMVLGLCATMTWGLFTLHLLMPRSSMAGVATSVSVWADASNVGGALGARLVQQPPEPPDGDSKGGPTAPTQVSATSISGNNHTITFGPGNKNLFLCELGEVFSTTGPVGGAPGIFVDLGSLPNTGNNEGSGFFSKGSTQVLFVGNESEQELYGVPITGSGTSVALGSPIASYDGEAGNESGDTGEPAEFDDIEGLGILAGTPTFDDAKATPMFATSWSGSPLVVNGTNFPIVDPNWSGRTVLAANEDDDNLIAMMILNDGTVTPIPGIALVETNGTPFADVSDADAVTVTADGRFAYVHDENDTDFYRFDLRHVDSTGGSSHVKEFNFTSQSWLHDPLLAFNGFLYAVASSAPPGGPNVLYRMGINNSTGDLGSPQLVTGITDGKGSSATGSGSRLATDGVCLYNSDSGSSLIFQICFTSPPAPAPALGPIALLMCAALLAAGGAWLLRKRLPKRS